MNNKQFSGGKKKSAIAKEIFTTADYKKSAITAL
jgi:hypothetical protein